MGSIPVRVIKKLPISGLGVFLCNPSEESNSTGRPQAATDSPVGCLFVRGSKRIRNVSRARLLLIPVRGIEQHGRPQTATDSPVGCLFVRGSKRIRNVCGARRLLMISFPVFFHHLFEQHRRRGRRVGDGVGTCGNGLGNAFSGLAAAGNDGNVRKLLPDPPHDLRPQLTQAGGDIKEKNTIRVKINKK